MSQLRVRTADQRFRFGIVGLVLMLLVWVFAASPARAARCAEDVAVMEPRVFLGLYDGRREFTPADTRLHKFIEFPLNFLGYSLRYVDVSKGGFPDADDPELAGVISWFDGPLDDPHSFAAWAAAARSECAESFGFVVFGETGLFPNKKPDAVEDAFLRRLGLRWHAKSILLGDFTEVAYLDRSLLGLESDFVFRPARYASVQGISRRDSMLSVVPAGKSIEDRLDLVVLRRPNAYVQQSATLDADSRGGADFWIVNPFEILRRSLPDDPRPIADVTTLNGRRIYFETVGPEGWLAPAPSRAFDEVPHLASENLRDHLVAPFQETPTTIAVVTGDLEQAIGGKPAAIGRQVAEQVFDLPQTAVATSGRSLVRYWAGLAQTQDPSTPASAAAVLTVSQEKPNRLLTFLGRNLREAFADPKGPAEPQLSDGLRQYGQDPFILEDETAGALRSVQALGPARDMRPLFLWSGDGKPGERALDLVAETGSAALGGGNVSLGRSSFLADLSPFGLEVGQSLQVYHALPGDLADLGYPTKDAHALHGLGLLVDRTDHPVRLKPFQLAYSAGSANQFGTRSAIERLKRLAGSTDVIPVFAERYVEMVEGFRSVQFLPAGQNRWRVLKRGGLQTVRFDNASRYALDAARSEGVLGARRINGSLYVALDPAVVEPLVALAADGSARGMVLPGGMIGLGESNLEVLSAAISNCQNVFTATGWGEGKISFFGDPDARYRLRITAGGPRRAGDVLGESHAVADASGFISIKVPTLHGKTQTIMLQRQCPGRADAD